MSDQTPEPVRITIVQKDPNLSTGWKQMRNNLILSACVFGPGLLADSAAMQWAGFVLYAALSFAVLVYAIHNHKLMTLTEAQAKLDKIKAERDAA